jgi:hypothetical protein
MSNSGELVPQFPQLPDAEAVREDMARAEQAEARLARFRVLQDQCWAAQCTVAAERKQAVEVTLAHLRAALPFTLNSRAVSATWHFEDQRYVDSTMVQRRSRLTVGLDHDAPAAVRAELRAAAAHLNGESQPETPRTLLGVTALRGNGLKLFSRHFPRHALLTQYTDTLLAHMGTMHISVTDLTPHNGDSHHSISASLERRQFDDETRPSYLDHDRIIDALASAARWHAQENDEYLATLFPQPNDVSEANFLAFVDYESEVLAYADHDYRKLPRINDILAASQPVVVERT